MVPLPWNHLADAFLRDAFQEVEPCAGRALGAGPSLTHLSSGRTIDVMGIELERVHGSVSAPILDGSAPPVDRPAPNTPAVELPWPALWHPTIHALDVAAPVVAGSAVVLATGDPSLGAGSGLLVGAVWLLRSVSISVPFSFGEGFLGYRGDPAWPKGVQEDDDVHWDWRTRPTAPDGDE